MAQPNERRNQNLNLRSLLASAALAATLFSGCSKSNTATNTPPANPAAPAQPAGPTSTAAGTPVSPAGSPAVAPGTAPAAGPAVSAPAPVTSAAAPVAPETLTLPAGTPVPVRITEQLSASHNDVGDRFSGAVAEDVIHHGVTVFRRGTRVEGTVVAAKGRGKFKGAGDLAIEVNSIGGQHVATSEYEVVAKGKGKRTAGFIGGGAGLGAIIGGIAGGGKGAAIGALAGGGAGTAAGAYTGNKDVVIPSESLIRFRLTEPVTVR